MVAGSASIDASSPGGIVITQSSSRAVIDWTSFELGSGEAVQIKAASTSAVTLLRVAGGDAAQIAGDVQSNGSIMLVDPAGVELSPGSMVAGASVLVSAPGISTTN
ncbi:MAG TPA: filamentous hemagglutinin N-terminal domain-containing protein, partial [Solirubrobacteraceae bacterium]|nr:filamentous hemagglutinin N-terminal domain-containing protein [Solirubrobacteraceae bacterium]